MAPKVLIVEDSSMVLKVIRHVANQIPDFEYLYAMDFASAREIVEREGDELFAAMVDLNLPDAPDGEVVDYVLKKGISTIVLTASFDEERREKLLSKGIVDYVTKEGKFSYQYAINLLKRIQKNQNIKVLLVDDSETSRYHVRNLLKQHLFHIYEACSGPEAIKILLANPDIKLLITDYNMAQMNGAELVQNIRHKYEKADMAIIGISADGEGPLSAKFIKAGANDFLHKPFHPEEFHCRVQHNIEALEHIELIRDAADRDYLTGVYNRRYFFNRGEELYQHAQEKGSPMAAAVLDVDHFKRLNDAYGFDGGDSLLQEFTNILREHLSRFLLARPSGEEFFILMPGLDNTKALALLSGIQEKVLKTPLFWGDDTIYLSFSAGVSNLLGESLQEQLNIANNYLSRAKEAGRNLVVGDDLEEDQAASGGL